MQKKAGVPKLGTPAFYSAHILFSTLPTACMYLSSSVNVVNSGCLHGAPDLLGDYHAAQVVNTSHDTGCFHIKKFLQSKVNLQT